MSSHTLCPAVACLQVQQRDPAIWPLDAAADPFPQDAHLQYVDLGACCDSSNQLTASISCAPHACDAADEVQPWPICCASSGHHPSLGTDEWQHLN
eukprot:CAMPEP_0172923698 /NCGR_PEP_ID=MMETSP1075-20121228/210244_1 /TAXON_ID=2916 /ORGANISM="Ceratium fusus, Strain PA161109" /LENGTH=95 /DNA_ID=CAMNT_0013784229 /DNA_START=427 /DNA_END=711 /DNA_ORIENTATION=-